MKFIILFLYFQILLCAENRYEDIDKIFADTKGNISETISSDIEQLNNPFLIKQESKNNSSSIGNLAVSVDVNITVLTLEAIFNSKRAKINGKWYKKGSNIAGIKILKIDEDRVHLSDRSVLTLSKKMGLIRRVDAQSDN